MGLRVWLRVLEVFGSDGDGSNFARKEFFFWKVGKCPGKTVCFLLALSRTKRSNVYLWTQQVLQLYRDPKTYSLKNLIYTTEEDFACEEAHNPTVLPIFWRVRMEG